jgi:hypothetical protein
MEEEFRDIPNYKGLYQVSNLGRVKSFKGKTDKMLKPRIDTVGYLGVNISKDVKSKNRNVHQLVAEAFLGHVPCGYKIVVDHIDENPLNNRLDNLQLLSHRANTSKGFKAKVCSSEYTGVCWDKSSKKWLSRILINGKRKNLGYFTCELEASEAYQKALKNI